MSTSDFFSEYQLGPNKLKNRVVMAPMTRNRATVGNVPSDLSVAYYRQRASAGLILTEASQIMPEGQGYPSTPGIHSKDQVAGWKKVTDAVHSEGGKIYLQLWHVGRISHSTYQPQGALPVAPSAIPATGMVFAGDGKMRPYETPRALDTVEIPKIIDQYRAAAKNAKDAGFDGVEVHGANGYLIDQFLQSGTNNREDIWGGPIENRARFLLEVTKAVIDVWGADRVGVRLSPNGAFNDMADENPLETFSYAVRELEKLGVSYLHFREGTPGDVKHGRQPIAIASLTSLFSRTIMLNDGYTREKAENALKEGKGHLFAFGAIYIANPDLVERLRRNASLTPVDPRTMYGGGEKGYIDYPTLETTGAR